MYISFFVWVDQISVYYNRKKVLYVIQYSVLERSLNSVFTQRKIVEMKKIGNFELVILGLVFWYYELDISCHRLLFKALWVPVPISEASLYD